jgi:hypothetical protein
VIRIEHGLRAGNILLELRALAPRQAQQHVEIVADDGRLGAHRLHGLELFQLGLGLGAGFLRQLEAVDLFLKLLNLVGFTLVAAAQFGLDRLELLVEVIFALGLFHLALHAATDLALHLKHAQFALHEGKHHFQTLERVGFREHGLLVGDLGGKVGGDRIGQLARVVDIAQLLPGILRELLGQLGIFGELIDHRAHHGRDFGPGHRLRLDRFDLRHQHGAIAAGFGLKGLEFGAPVPLDEHAHGAIGQLEQLEHRGDHAGFIKVVAVRVVAAGVELGEQEDFLRAGHRGFERGHRLFTAHEQRHDHAGNTTMSRRGSSG